MAVEVPAGADGPGEVRRLAVACRLASACLLALLAVPVVRDLFPVWAAAGTYGSTTFVIPLWSAWLAWTSRSEVRGRPWAVEPWHLGIVAAGLVVWTLGRA